MEQRRKILIFSLQGTRFGVELSDVVEIVDIRGFLDIPDTYPYKTVMFRENIFFLVDAFEKIGISSEAAPDFRRQAIILDAPAPVGLMVPPPVDITGFLPEQITGIPGVIEETIKNDFLKYVAVRGEDLVLVIDKSKLLADDEIVRINELKAQIIK